MTDPDDLMLAALFEDAEDDHAGVSGPVFTQRVMTAVTEMQARRKVLVDTLLWAIVTCVAVICTVVTPTAWLQIQAAWVKNTAAFGLSDPNLMLVAVLMLSGLGWAVAVQD
jgi:uncharacterized membrane protein (UPF0182 family)